MSSPSDAAELVAETTGSRVRDGRGVARNFVFLVAGQLATAALSLGVTAMLARHLGAQDYGVFYLAATLVQSAFVLADLGQQYYVVGRIARDPSAAAPLLGTGLALRLLGALVLWPLLAGLALVLDYPEATRVAIALTVVFVLASSIGDSVTIVLRGLERMDIGAVTSVAAKLLIAVAIAVAVISTGGLRAVLIAQILGSLAAVGVYWLALRRLHIAPPRVSWPAAVSLLSGGAPFLLWAVAVHLQPGVDALLLSVLAPPSVIGWYAAASKLMGLLIFPATILATALYPTLARLQAERAAAYGDLMTAALRVMVLLGILSMAGTYLFADTAVGLVYGSAAFAPAASCLRVLALYLLVAFVDVTLGAAIMAGTAPTRWIVAKLATVLVAAGLSVVLIPLTQSTLGNGGIGCAAAVVAAEVVMLITALRLVPLDSLTLVSGLSKNLGLGGIAALVMAGTAWMLRDSNPLGGMTISVGAYLATVYLLGAIRREDLRFMRDALRDGRA